MKRHPTCERLRVWLAASALLAAGAVHADGDYFSPTEDRVRLSLGIVRESAVSSVRLDSSTGAPGDNVDAERTFGLHPVKYEPKFEAMVRAGERHRVWFDYFELDRTGFATLNQFVQFRDALLLPGDPVQSEVSLRTFGVTYGYSIWHGNRLEVAATFGIESAGLLASARVQTATRHIYESDTGAGPFPVLGAAATWVASRRFYFDARAQYFRVSVGHLDGSLGIYEFDALYRLRPNVSFALGYSDVQASLSSTQPTQSGYFDLSAKGPQFFVRVAF